MKKTKSATKTKPNTEIPEVSDKVLAVLEESILVEPASKKKRMVGKPRSADSEHYVDWKPLTVEVTKYSDECRAAKAAGLPKPRMSESIGTAILTIATRLADKGSFANYTYKDDFIGDAVENCLRYASGFDASKVREGGSGAFSYFTQIAYCAFLRRIDREKKQAAIKFRCVKNAIDMEHGGSFHGDSDSDAMAELSNSVVPVEYTPRQRKKTVKPVVSSLEV